MSLTSAKMFGSLYIRSVLPGTDKVSHDTKPSMFELGLNAVFDMRKYIVIIR